MAVAVAVVRLLLPLFRLLMLVLQVLTIVVAGAIDVDAVVCGELLLSLLRLRVRSHY